MKARQMTPEVQYSAAEGVDSTQCAGRRHTARPQTRCNATQKLFHDQHRMRKLEKYVITRVQPRIQIRTPSSDSPPHERRLEGLRDRSAPAVAHATTPPVGRAK